MTMLRRSGPRPAPQHLPLAESVRSRHRQQLLRTVQTHHPPFEGQRARSSPSRTTHRGAGHLHCTLPGKAWEKAASKSPKSHINARNPQKKIIPKSHIDAGTFPALPRRCCRRRRVCYTPPSRPGPHPVFLQVESLSCLHAAGRVGGSLAAVGVLSPTLQTLRLTREQYLAGRQSRAYEGRSRRAACSHSWATTRRVTRAQCSPEELEAANTTRPT